MGWSTYRSRNNTVKQTFNKKRRHLVKLEKSKRHLSKGKPEVAKESENAELENQMIVVHKNRIKVLAKFIKSWKYEKKLSRKTRTS